MLYTIKDNLLQGKDTSFKIVQVLPNGIKILDEADNGVEISRVIPWAKIVR